MMSTRIVSAVLVLSLGLFLVGCKGKQKGAALGEPVPVEGQVSGQDAALKASGTWLITSQAQFDALGSQELAKLQPDFDRDSVVVAAMGERKSGGYWARIEGIQVVGSTLYVQVTRNQPGEGQATSQQITHAYAAVVIPKVAEGTSLVAENTSTSGQRP